MSNSDKGHVEPAVNRSVSARPETRLFKLKHAEASEVAKTLTALFGDRAPKTVKILADERTNTVIVQGNTEEQQEISNVLERLDEDTVERDASRAIVQVFPLRFAKAKDLADTLNILFADKGQAVKIAADTRTNSIILQANEEKANEIRQLIKRLDVEH